MCDVIPGHFQSIAQVFFFSKKKNENVQVSHHTFNSSLAENRAVKSVFTHTNVLYRIIFFSLYRL